MNKNHTRFYLLLTITLLLFVLIGFSRTFYLRSYFDQPPRLDMAYLPWKYILHGCAMTLWFIILAVQSALVTKRKIKIHQTLGYGSILIAFLVTVTSVLIMFESTPRLLRDGILDPENKQAMQAQASGIFYSLFATIIFSILIAIAFIKRKHRVIHRTFMLYGSIAMIIPAVNRVYFFTSKLPAAMEGLIMILLFIGPPLAIIIHDWVKMKRFPIWAVLCFGIYITLIAMTTIIPQTAWGHQFFLQFLNGRL
jgi:hypothetical protein